MERLLAIRAAVIPPRAVKDLLTCIAEGLHLRLHVRRWGHDELQGVRVVRVADGGRKLCTRGVYAEIAACRAVVGYVTEEIVAASARRILFSYTLYVRGAKHVRLGVGSVRDCVRHQATNDVPVVIEESVGESVGEAIAARGCRYATGILILAI